MFKRKWWLIRRTAYHPYSYLMLIIKIIGIYNLWFWSYGDYDVYSQGIHGSYILILNCEIHMNYFSLPSFLSSVPGKKLFSATIPSVHPVVTWSKTVKEPLTLAWLSREIHKRMLFQTAFIIAQKRAIFPFPLTDTGSGILSHPHRLDRSLSVQGACTSRLHPCSSDFSTEDDGSMLLKTTC